MRFQPPGSSSLVVTGAFVVPLLAASVFAACAEGTTLGASPTGSGSDDGGGRGDGGRDGGGGRDGEGGDPGSPSGNGGGPASSGSSVTSSGSASSGQTTSSASSASSAASSTASSAASSSSSGGGPVDCDPMNPSPACGGGQHCFPAPDGVTGCGDAGNGQHYDACSEHTDCMPATVCINFGEPIVCCQMLCRGFLDCPGFQDCYPFDEPLFDGDGNEYGFCNDGLFDCIEP